MITGLIIPGFSCAPRGRPGSANIETVLISKDVVRLSGAIFGKIKLASIRPKPLIWSATFSRRLTKANKKHGGLCESNIRDSVFLSAVDTTREHSWVWKARVVQTEWERVRCYQLNSPVVTEGTQTWSDWITLNTHNTQHSTVSLISSWSMEIFFLFEINFKNESMI